MTNFYVCDACGHLWTADPADPAFDAVCPEDDPECGSDAIWQFDDLDKAEQHSRDIFGKILKEISS